MHAVLVRQGRMTALIRCFKKVVKERGSAIITIPGFQCTSAGSLPEPAEISFTCGSQETVLTRDKSVKGESIRRLLAGSRGL